MASKAMSKAWQARTQRQWQKELGRHSSKVLMVYLVVGWAGKYTYWRCTLRGGPVGERSYSLGKGATTRREKPCYKVN